MLIALRHLACAVLLTFLAIGLAGCGGERAKCYLEGRITFQGRPVTDCDVVFFAPAVGGASATLEVDGTFRVKGAVDPGEYLVTIVTLAPPPGATMGMNRPPAAAPKPATSIPKKYRQEQTTDLKVKVVPGKNQFDFDLKP